MQTRRKMRKNYCNKNLSTMTKKEFMFNTFIKVTSIIFLCLLAVCCLSSPHSKHLLLHTVQKESLLLNKMPFSQLLAWSFYTWLCGWTKILPSFCFHLWNFLLHRSNYFLQRFFYGRYWAIVMHNTFVDLKYAWTCLALWIELLSIARINGILRSGFHFALLTSPQ